MNNFLKGTLALVTALVLTVFDNFAAEEMLTYGLLFRGLVFALIMINTFIFCDSLRDVVKANND